MHPQAKIWTEGKTDWQHLKRAFDGLGVAKEIAFHEFDHDFGDDQLLKQCAALARVEQPVPTIFIFDRDNEDTVRRVMQEGQMYKVWGNNVFSFAIPTPAHRDEKSGICIELYYTDNELRSVDSAGRRLFLSNEFNPTSRRHLVQPNLNLGSKAKLPIKGNNDRVLIIDTDVFDETSQNVALSKADFADKVSNGDGMFGQFNFEPFRSIATVIKAIIETSREKIDLFFPDRVEFLSRCEDLEKPEQFAELVKAIIRTCKLATTIFVGATLRYYEQRILDATGTDAPKVKPIKQLLSQNFGQPSLATLQKLARHCYHLIDETAPNEIRDLRAMLDANPTLGAVGDLLDDLERVFGPPRVRSVNKSQLKKSILDYVLKELARYESGMADLPELPSKEFLNQADATKWQDALSTVLDFFGLTGSLIFRVREIKRVRTDTDEFEGVLTTYQHDGVSVQPITEKYEDFDDSRLKSYELLLASGESESSLDLFPFIVLIDSKLQYYRRTRARGYEYSIVSGSPGHLEPNKKRFSHLALRTTIAADLQALFATRVTPTISQTGVKQNIPAHGEIVGRKQQITDIVEQIIEIPNQNGILYGPGGVGKTALLIELSRNLKDKESSTPGYFQNIIWVSAKPNYYDPSLDRVDRLQSQFQSLDNVLAAILDFHEIEDGSAYQPDERKYLVLELLRDEKTLLILDNFENVARSGQDEILWFFGVKAKQALKDKPDYLKVLITSRVLVPSGFHQLQLKGLDKRESKQLMQRLYEPYARSGKAQRTPQEMDAIYDATQGIPLIVKHCYGQIYEYNREVETVLRQLSKAGNNVVEFSFAEVFDLLKRDELQLRMILLLELSARRLMSRQIADILVADETEVVSRLGELVNFQCAVMVTTGTDEKYGINDEVRFLTRRLTIEHADLSTAIKRKIAALALDKRMDYTRQEFEAVLAFDDYLSQGHYVLGENYLNEQLADNKGSSLLNLRYAKYLKEIKGRTQEAIDRLESILLTSGYDQQVLRLLMQYYTALQIPNFEQANTYARELEDIAADNKDIKWELASFYVQWSTAVKMKVEIDLLREKVRQLKYKELADLAIKFLKDIDLHTHEWHFLLAQAYYNRWDNDLALRQIDKAIAALPKESHFYAPYRRLKGLILKKRDFYFDRHVARVHPKAKLP